MRDAGSFVVRSRAAQLVFGDFFMRHRLDHVRPGDEHVRGLVDHQNEVGDRRRIHGAARARPHDGRDLRHHAAVERVAQKNVGVAGQRHHAFLNASAARVIQADDRRAHLGGQVHDLHDLAGVRFGERSAEHREVLREHKDQPAFDAAVTGDEPVAVKLLLRHAEVAAAVGDQLVGLFERAFIEQELDALARRHLAFFMLLLAALLASALFGQVVALFQFFQLLFEVHGAPIIGDLDKAVGNVLLSDSRLLPQEYNRPHARRSMFLVDNPAGLPSHFLRRQSEFAPDHRWTDSGARSHAGRQQSVQSGRPSIFERRHRPHVRRAATRIHPHRSQRLARGHAIPRRHRQGQFRAAKWDLLGTRLPSAVHPEPPLLCSLRPLRRRTNSERDCRNITCRLRTRIKPIPSPNESS